jgi:peptide maturation system protein (TIGR04066 family)
MGYKVSQIGSRNYCEVFGFHSFPRFMYSTEYTEDEKIIRFNNYLVEVEHLEKPDVILLGISGGVMPINDRDIGNFGVKAFEVSQAVVPDVTILNTQYEAGVNEEYYKNFAKQIRNKFGFEVNFFNIVDKCIDWQNVNMYNVFNYCTIASDRIEVLKEDIRNSSDLSIYSAVKESDLKELAENVIDTLASYAEDIEAI